MTKTSLKPLSVDPMDAKNADLRHVTEMVQACIQCGTCTGSCPNAFAMDLTPRRLWRMVLMDLADDIFQSKTFTLCSVCYYCSLRCPRGLALTEAMSELKQVAARRKFSNYKGSTLFYQKFIESVRRHGRVREMEFMTLYFNAMRNPLLPIKFASLGFKLMRKGKLHLQIPSKGSGRMEAIFHKVESLEQAP